MPPDNFERGMELLRRQFYGEVADYCEQLHENNE